MSSNHTPRLALATAAALLVGLIGPIAAHTHAAPDATEAPEGDIPSLSRAVSLPESDVPVDIRPSDRTGSGLTEGFGPTTGSHVDITNADAWQNAGITGAGVKVGVIDFFDIPLYWNTAEHGPLPVANVTAKCFDRASDCINEMFDGNNLGGEDHGVAVVETILDMAPGALIFLGQATTVSDYRLLIDWFVANGVTVVNRSLGSRYDGPGDGRGALSDVAAEAVSKGILWVNSGGNNGRDKYYRQQVRLSVDNFVQFGPTGTNTFIRFKNCIALAGVRWVNDWDKAIADRSDYDVFLYESPTGSPSALDLVDSSTRAQLLGADPLEDSIDDRCPAYQRSLYLRVQYHGGGAIDGDVLEILDYGAGFADSSLTQRAYTAAVSVVDSKSPGVVAVGAIDPAASGTIGFFSSEGPTNDGRITPAVAAPSGFANSLYGTFQGTSASAAVVTGGAALLVDASLATDPSSLGNLIRYLTIDRGSVGPDNLYGNGEFRLPAPPVDGIDATPSKFVPAATPTRLLDTRTTSPVGPTELIGTLHRGEILDLPVTGTVGVPPFGATAVVVNIVNVRPDGAGYIQALPTLRADLGSYSNLNTDGAGQTRANLAIVPIGDAGRISIYSSAGGDVVVDLLGWFERAADPTTGGRFVELAAAQRLLDTRIDPPAAPLTTGAVRAVPLPAGVDPSLIGSLIVTVTATRASGPGWVQALPADRLDSIGSTSTVNVPPGTAVANTAIVAVGPSGFVVTGSFGTGGSAHVVVDAIGYITSAAAPSSGSGRFVAVRPSRAFDSRSTNSPLADGQVVPVNASGAPGVSLPADATGVVWNLAVVRASRPGFLRGWAASAVEPETSALNWTLPGETRASSVVTAVDSGSALFRIEDGDVNLPTPVGHLLADVFGYFT